MSPDIDVFPTCEAASRAATHWFVQRARRAVSERGRFVVALSGGATPRRLYQLLAAPPARDEIPWDRAVVFFGDERLVPPDHPESNFNMASQTLLSHVPVAQENIHRVRTELPPAEAAADYTREILELVADTGFDMVLLGMGSDGHTASLFPGSDALRATDRGAVADHVEAVSPWRVSLTLSEINHAQAVLFLVCGRGKAHALRSVRIGHDRLPAAMVHPPEGELSWFADRDAVVVAPEWPDQALEDTARVGEPSKGAGQPSALKSSQAPSAAKPDLEALKARTGARAAAIVESGMQVGLGTGSTARWFVEALGARLSEGDVTDVVGVPTSEATAALAKRVGIPLATLAEVPALDVTVDGADEVSPDLDLVKGLGGALLREKIVAGASRRIVIVADHTKLVERLGTRSPLPVAVAPFGWQCHLEAIETLGATPVLRTDEAGQPVVTDDGLYLIDCRFPEGILDPAAVDRTLRARPGVVETGLFIHMADTAIIADALGLLILHRD
jgi:ribose 5-phosphate isomerase A